MPERVPPDDGDEPDGLYSIDLRGPTWMVFEQCEHKDFNEREMVAHLVIQALSMARVQVGGYWDELAAELCCCLTNYDDDSSELSPTLAKTRAALRDAAWDFRNAFRDYREKRTEGKDG